ncbi:excinuclease ABC subunit UvrC [Sulfurospirillum sp. 1612]|uniref:excinuclease ABC subunit UvrC n=1 Tax=Sulfurospirillum sp. 1612 TaxID=3094835 RepID=UPI002F94AA95
MSLREQLKTLPQSSGVYQYFDEDGHLLYVGKAKNLKNRVKSYFRSLSDVAPARNLSARITKMIHEAKELKYILVENEHDALILENSLIKQLKPKYNILLRDDKTYPYISIDLDEAFPRFEITRKIIKKKNVKYFGPFSSASREIMESLYLLFNLVQKKGCLKSKKACLFYQMQRCHAPCEGKISAQEYATIVQEAISALKNRKKMLALLEKQMQKAVSLEHFEEAARIRDMIQAIRHTTQITQVDLARLEDFDIFYVHEEAGHAIIIKMFIREGKIISTDHTLLKNSTGFDKDELYKRAILQFYGQDAPLLCSQILVGHDFKEKETLEEYLMNLFGKKIKITTPKRGEKTKLIAISQKNAHYLLGLEKKKKDPAKEIQELFDLKRTPYRIEVFDNSHMGGVATVGGMIVWEGKFDKSSYRKYNLNETSEYAQMRELLTRRIQDFKSNPMPDLWLLDGGMTLLKLAMSLLEDHHIMLEVLAISKEKHDAKSNRSKGRAKDILHCSQYSLSLPTQDQRLQFLQRLRDEAHRFAISFHQKKKRSLDLNDPLQSIEGVGPATIKKLLSYFGTYDHIYKASLEELKSLINANLAKKIHTFCNS